MTLLPASLGFLLVSFPALQFVNGRLHGDSAAYNGVVVNENKYFTTDGNREKRTFSPFMHAWTALLKTTFAFQKSSHQNIPEKTFLKIGSLDDAVKDFYSLGPTKIQNSPGFGLEGVVNDRVAVYLKTPGQFNDPPTVFIMDTKTARAEKAIIDNTVNINVRRMIIYYDTMAKAKASVRNFHTYRFRQ